MVIRRDAAIGLALIGAAGFLIISTIALRNPGFKDSTSPEKALSSSDPIESTPGSSANQFTPKVADRLKSLLKELLNSIMASDRVAMKRIVGEIQTIGPSVVLPIRDDLLENPSTWSAYPLYRGVIISVLMSMSSPPTSKVLLSAFGEIDSGQCTLDEKQATLLLRGFSAVIAKGPHAEVPLEVIGLFRSAKTNVVKKALIGLMGSLSPRFPLFKDELARILEEDSSKEIRAAAASAIAAENPENSVPELTRAFTKLMTLEEYASGSELTAVTQSLLAALPMDLALELLTKYVDDAPNLGNVNSVGLVLGTHCARVNSAGMESIYLRALVDDQPERQALYLSAMVGSSAKGQRDARAVDIALDLLDRSSNETVRATALSALVSHSTDENTILKSIDKLRGGGDSNRSWAELLLLQYCDRHSESLEATGLLRKYLSEGDTDERLSSIRRIAVVEASPPQCLRKILVDLRDNDADPEVRRVAGLMLK